MFNTQHHDDEHEDEHELQEQPLMRSPSYHDDHFSNGVFPTDILFHIFTFVSNPTDLVNICATCKQWYLISNDDVIWKPIISRRLPREAVFSTTLNCTVSYKIAKTIDDIKSNYRDTYVTLRRSARDIALREDSLNAELTYWNENIFRFLLALSLPLFAHVIYVVIIFLAMDRTVPATGTAMLAWLPEPILFTCFIILYFVLVLRFWRTYHMLHVYERMMHMLGNEVFVPGKIILLYQGATRVWWIVLLLCSPIGVTCILLGRLFSYSLAIIPVYLIMYAHLVVSLAVIAYSVRNAAFYGWMEQGGEFTLLGKRVSYRLMMLLFCCFLDAFLPVQIGVACARMDEVIGGNWGVVLIPFWMVLAICLFFGCCGFLITRLKSRSTRRSRIVRL
jgi:hypothetical protein